LNPVSALRRQADLEKLRALAARMPGTLEILRVTGSPAETIKLRLRVPTARNSNFPREIQPSTDVEIALNANYPMPPGPAVNILTPVWNPNIFASGRWCSGTWRITENLELFVIRLMKLLAFDHSIINTASPANDEASRWYNTIKRQTPGIFPTMDLSRALAVEEKPKIGWKPIR
jgi:hypothetical protein